MWSQHRNYWNTCDLIHVIEHFETCAFFQYRVSVFLYYTILSDIIIPSYYIFLLPWAMKSKTALNVKHINSHAWSYYLYTIYYTDPYIFSYFILYYLVPPKKNIPMMPLALADAPVARWPLPASPRPPATGQLSGLGPGRNSLGFPDWKILPLTLIWDFFGPSEFSRRFEILIFFWKSHTGKMGHSHWWTT